MQIINFIFVIMRRSPLYTSLHYFKLTFPSGMMILQSAGEEQKHSICENSLVFTTPEPGQKPKEQPANGHVGSSLPYPCAISKVVAVIDGCATADRRLGATGAEDAPRLPGELRQPAQHQLAAPSVAENSSQSLEPVDPELDTDANSPTAGFAGSAAVGRMQPAAPEVLCGAARSSLSLRLA